MTAPASVAPEVNGIGAALGLLGDEWSLLLVRELLPRARRFSDLQRRLGIGPAVLSARLAALVDRGVVEATDAPGYRLTPAGYELWRVLLCIWAWEQRWVARADLPTMRHAVCGNVFAPVLACGCGTAVTTADVRLRPGPSGAMNRSVPSGSRRRRTGSHSVAGPGLFPETMTLLGSRWSSAVLGAAFLGAQRFTDFEQALGAPPGVLSERLRQFVAVGVLDTRYSLTEKGRAFFATVVELVAWGERWHQAVEGPALVAEHAGHEFLPRLQCSVCRARLARTEVIVQTPASAERSAAQGLTERS